MVTFNFFIVYKNYAAVIGFNSCNKFYKGRFTSPIFAKESMYLAFGNFKINSTERNGAPVDLA